MLSVKDGEKTPIDLTDSDKIEIIVKTTVLDSETPRESERSTPARKNTLGDSSRRRNTVI